jgi:hypothetical protein
MCCDDRLNPPLIAAVRRRLLCGNAVLDNESNALRTAPAQDSQAQKKKGVTLTPTIRTPGGVAGEPPYGGPYADGDQSGRAVFMRALCRPLSRLA